MQDNGRRSSTRCNVHVPCGHTCSCTLYCRCLSRLYLVVHHVGGGSSMTASHEIATVHLSGQDRRITELPVRAKMYCVFYSACPLPVTTAFSSIKSWVATTRRIQPCESDIMGMSGSSKLCHPAESVHPYESKSWADED